MESSLLYASPPAQKDFVLCMPAVSVVGNSEKLGRTHRTGMFLMGGCLPFGRISSKTIHVS